MELSKDYVAAILIIALSLIIGLHLALLWLHGHVVLSESSEAIRIVESFGTLALLAFGVERLRNAIRQRK